MGDTRAELLTAKLKNDFGNVPLWNVSTTQQCLDAHDTHWQIKRTYCEWAHDYNRFRPLARMVYRACKKDIGELPDVNTETIKQWIMVDGLIDTEIKAKYQLLYDDTLPNMRKAKKLLAELRRDEGDCHKIGELRALKWIEDKFDMKDIIKSYRYHITEAKLFGRAEALRYRLQDELKCRDVPSILELRILFHNNLNDNAIAAYYLEKISRPSKEEITAAGVSSLIDTAS